jgi:hypothetical protein
MNAALRVFSIEVVEAPSIALVVATLSLLGSAELQKLGDSLPLSSQKKCSKPILAQSSMRRMSDYGMSVFGGTVDMAQTTVDVRF